MAQPDYISCLTVGAIGSPTRRNIEEAMDATTDITSGPTSSFSFSE
jgi:hypothetical protein